MKPSEEDILQALEARERQTTGRVRQTLLAEGRPDLVADLDKTVRDIDTGVYGARITWNALSEAQRRALRFANDTGGQLYRIGPNSYCSRTARTPSRPIRLATARNLIARELLACDGGAFDPEKLLVLTERGRFALKHGPESLSSSPSKKEGKR